MVASIFLRGFFFGFFFLLLFVWPRPIVSVRYPFSTLVLCRCIFAVLIADGAGIFFPLPTSRFLFCVTLHVPTSLFVTVERFLNSFVSFCPFGTPFFHHFSSQRAVSVLILARDP